MALVTQKKKRSTSSHDRRRQGRHHKHTHDYRKAYWPYLPMAFIVALGILANTFWGTIQHSVLSYATNMTANGLLQETNSKRAAGGLGNLALNAKLSSAAQTKADDMADRNYWSHDTPEGNPPWVFIDNAGYSYKSAGENLAYGFDNSTEAVAGWMASPGHKANIMDSGYTEVGFGIANASNYQGTGPQTIVVAMYASPQVLAAAPANPVPAQSPTPSTAGSAPAAEPKPVKEESKPEPKPAPKAEHNTTKTTAKGNGAKESEPPVVAAQTLSRFQLLSGATAPWSVFAVSALATVAIAIFFLRHGLLLRRALVKSEAFIHKHPFLDIALVAVATIGFVLIQTDGIIR